MKRVAISVCLLTTTMAHAYVRTTDKVGAVVRWPISCVVVQPDARGDQSSDNIDIGTINDTLGRAVSNWNSKIDSCTFMRLGMVDANQALDATNDGRPAVVFRSDMWGTGDGDMLHSPSVIALTTVWSVDQANDPTSATNGQITDADIELNAVNYTFSVNVTQDTARAGTKLADLENTLTHELGHVLGLGHTCWDHVASTPPLDNNGNPIPDCQSTNLPASITGATMYPYVTSNPISMRNLSADDIAGICDTYPSTSAATACYGYIESRGCETAPPMSHPRTWLLGLVPLAWLWRRRRRGRL